MQPVLEVQNLRKTYGTTVAVEDILFSVQPGEIFGILGPNGAGKTTTVESIIGLRKPDRGSVRVLGLDPQRERTALAQRIGVQLQQANLADRLKVWEALDLFGSFYARTVPWQPLLDQWGLAEKRNTAFVNLSGGQKQRLFITLDRPASLVRSLGLDSRVIFESDAGVNLAGLRALPQASEAIQNGQRVTVYGKGDGLVSGVVKELEVQHIPFQNLRTEQPSLEDVFIHLTGRKIRE